MQKDIRPFIFIVQCAKLFYLPLLILLLFFTTSSEQLLWSYNISIVRALIGFHFNIINTNQWMTLKDSEEETLVAIAPRGSSMAGKENILSEKVFALSHVAQIKIRLISKTFIFDWHLMIPFYHLRYS